MAISPTPVFNARVRKREAATCPIAIRGLVNEIVTISH
jgi:hypothetical protein